MSVWNYRVIFTPPERKNDPDDPGRYAVHEVHYGDDGKPAAFTVNPVAADADTVEGLKWTVEEFIRALALPVLTPADFENVTLP